MRPLFLDSARVAWRSAGAVLLATVAALACARSARESGDRSTVAAESSSSQGAMPGMAGRPGGMRGMMGGHAMAATPAQVALGDSIYHGRAAGGTCFTCHGADARGTPLAPDLTDGTWLHADGSMMSIMHVVMHGVAQPRVHPAPMPPMGGAKLTHAQGRAVAAYVHGLRARR